VKPKLERDEKSFVETISKGNLTTAMKNHFGSSNRLRLWGALVLLLVLLLVAAVWQRWQAPLAKQSARVRIGYQALAANLPFFVATEKGFFRLHGLDVEAVRFETADAAADALLRGDIASDFSLPMLVFLSREEKVPGSLVAYGFQMDTPEFSHEAILVSSDSDIKTIADLRSKVIGVFPGVAAKTYLTEALIKAGLARTEVDAKPLQIQLHLQALRAKQIDALLAYEPTISIAKSEGYGRVLETAVFPRYLQNPFPVTVFAMPRSFVSEHPKEARKIVSAIADAIDYVKGSPSDANETVVKFANLPDASLAPKLSQLLSVLATDVDDRSLQKFVDWHKDIGLVEKGITMDNVLYREPRELIAPK